MIYHPIIIQTDCGCIRLASPGCPLVCSSEWHRGDLFTQCSSWKSHIFLFSRTIVCRYVPTFFLEKSLRRWRQCTLGQPQVPRCGSAHFGLAWGALMSPREGRVIFFFFRKNKGNYLHTFVLERKTQVFQDEHGVIISPLSSRFFKFILNTPPGWPHWGRPGKLIKRTLYLNSKSSKTVKTYRFGGKC